jgi:hypothetical protein
MVCIRDGFVSAPANTTPDIARDRARPAGFGDYGLLAG